MGKIRKMREKQKKKKIATYISNKIMDLAKNLEKNILIKYYKIKNSFNFLYYYTINIIIKNIFII